jgi:hypothetical protein
MSARTPEDAPQDMVTVIRLVRLGRAEGQCSESAIVTSFGRASMRTEEGAVFLVVGDELTRGRLKVGDIVQWVAEPLGVVWLAERAVDDAYFPLSRTSS